ncbi:MAG: nitrate/nitrite transporter NrtS [Sphingomicrobium sp.]
MRNDPAFRATFRGRALRRSLIVALVIGTLLNAINQGPEVLAGQPPVWWKILLTYFVPFAVASYGSYAALASRD